MSSQNKISDVVLEGLDKARFVRSFSMRFKMGDRQRRWELLQIHDSVAIMMYNKDQKKLVFVRQFRPAVFVKNFATKHGLDLDSIVNEELRNLGKSHELAVQDGEEQLGMTMELCAGIVDKKASAAEIAVAEVFEETGYSVKPDDLILVRSYKNGVGTAASKQTIYYVDVTDSQRTGTGGGLASEGESIEVLHLTEEETQQMLDDDSIDKPLGLIFALQWRKMKLAGLL